MSLAYKCNDCGVLMETYYPKTVVAELKNGLDIHIARIHDDKEYQQCPSCALKSLATALTLILGEKTAVQMVSYIGSTSMYRFDLYLPDKK